VASVLNNLTFSSASDIGMRSGLSQPGGAEDVRDVVYVCRMATLQSMLGLTADIVLNRTRVGGRWGFNFLRKLQ
jgi:hypothetical protein